MIPKQVTVNGLVLEFPEYKHGDDILFVDLPTKNQKWTRQDIPDHFEEGWWEAPTEEHIAFMMRELDRILHGVWISINGEVMWISGINYFYLNYWVLDTGDYPSFRMSDVKFFWWWHICQTNPRCLGTVFTKFRRQGASSRGACIGVYISITESNVSCGIVSKTGDDAKEIFTSMVVNGFKGLEDFLKPQSTGTDKAVKELIIAKQSERMSKNRKIVGKQEGLNNKIDWRPTALNSYDGKRLRYLFADECFGKGTKILMADMTFKNIEDISVGEYVMVEGGKKVKVAKTCTGIDNLFLVKQKSKKDYVVSSKHRLYLDYRPSSNYTKTSGEVSNYNGVKKITPIDYLSYGKHKKRVMYGVTSHGLHFDEKQLPIDPYYLGLWLGDGDGSSTEIYINHVDDDELIDYMCKFSYENNMRFSINKHRTSKKCIGFYLTDCNNRWNNNSFRRKFIDNNLHKNKHIPDIYLNSSYNQRLQLLAGIIDSDGYLAFRNNSYAYEVGMSRKDLIDKIAVLARSLGFRVVVSTKKSNFNTDVFRVMISGDLSKIPTKVARKKVPDSYKTKYSPNINKIDIEPIGVGEYYGITLLADSDDDRRLILEDFTLSMNCGKYPKDVPADKYWSVVRRCLVEGVRRRGMAYVPSTVNEMDKGGDSFKRVWDASNHFSKEFDGITASGLFKYFQPAYDGFEGYIGEYGESIIDSPTPDQTRYLREIGCPEPTIGAREYQLKERARLQAMGDEDALSEYIRQFPHNEREAFYKKANDSHFNPMHINRQLEQIDVLNIKPRQVNFMRNTETGKVDMIDAHDGRWSVIWDFPSPDLSNKCTMRRGALEPLNIREFAMGCDPFAHSEVAYGKGSNGAAFIHRKFNPLDPNNSDMPVAMYLARPKRKETMFQDWALAAEYYGCKIGVEQVNDEYYGWFTENRLDSFLIWTPEALSRGADNRVKKKTPGIPATGVKAIEYHLTIMVEYMLHNSHKIWFEALLKDMMEFDVEDRTKYDLTMAFGYSLITAKDMDVRQVAPEANETTIIRTYRHSGGSRF